MRVFNALLAVCEAAGDNQVIIHTDSPKMGLFSFRRVDKELVVAFRERRRDGLTQKHTARFNDCKVHITCRGTFDETGKRVVFRDGGQSEQVIVDFLKEWLGQVKHE